MTNYGLHKLIDSQSPHYDTEDEKSAIELMEEEITIVEMIGYCKGNIFKYKYRLNKKGQKASDIIKIVKYTNYLKELTLLKHMDGINDSMLTSRAWRLAGITWDYG